MTKRIKFPSLVVLFKIVSAQVDYAVYYDPSTSGGLNTRGSGYDPEKPSNWDKVDKGTWPIFLDWGKYLKDTSDWYNRGNNGNECEDRSSSSYSSKHMQSPIMLRSDDTCDDRH